MDKIKRFITCHVPVYACNFRCSYCYVGQHPNAYKNGIRKFCISPREIADFFSIDRTGGVCYFNLCAAGETFLHPELEDLVCELTERGHYVDVITNGVLTDKIRSLVNNLTINQRKHLFLKFSFHYLELKTKGLLDTYVSNVNWCRENNVSVSVEITPHDELIDYFDEIKTFSLQNFNALPHITVARNENTKEIKILSNKTNYEYYKIWRDFDSQLFNFKFSIFNQKRREFCYAGDWSLYVSLLTGDYYQCYGGNLLGNIKRINKPINFCAIGHCKQPHCWNGHAFLSLGTIPNLNTPTYRDLRDRRLKNCGGNWLEAEIADFFDSKLVESNREFPFFKKNLYLIWDFVCSPINRVYCKIKRLFNKNIHI